MQQMTMLAIVMPTMRPVSLLMALGQLYRQDLV